MRIGNLPGGPPVQMSLSLPEGWLYKESFTVLAPDGQSNVIFSSEPLDESVTTFEYADMQGDLLAKEFDDYRLTSFEEFALRDEGVAYIRTFEWIPPDGVPVKQAQIYYATPGRGFTATATATRSHFPEVSVTLMDALRSIAVVEEKAAVSQRT
jgi:hypothetical protein